MLSISRVASRLQWPTLRSRTFQTSLRYYSESSQPSSAPGEKERTRPAQSTIHPAQNLPLAKHEVQERSEAINIPFNPPGGGGGPGPGGSGGSFQFTGSPFFDATLTTLVGLGVVFVGGVAYLRWYKKNVLDKIELAFEPGYDPALEVARHYDTTHKDAALGLEDPDSVPWTEHLRRREQDRIDRMVKGEEVGHYYVLLGPKGSGKGTMIYDSMSAIKADGVAMCDAHPDLEVFRLRLGKALNYEYNEDSQTGLFQRRDPREGGAALDIERALNKLEKVALRCARRRHKPLVLIINNVHYFNNDEAGRNMLLQLQQRAEAWAASGIMTMIFSTDDFWPFHVMRKVASRMHVLSISDLDTREALHACTRMRANVKNKIEHHDHDQIKEAVSIVGGRLSYLNKVASSKDVLEMSNSLLEIEKAWLLSQIGLIQDCDDDVMDEQKWSSCSWLLLQEFVKMRQEQEKERDEGLQSLDQLPDLPMPSLPYYKCRQIMTRADFLEELDRVNIISIDMNHNVRPDSMLILLAARQVVEMENFEEVLNSVRDRIDEIESLHRTRELTFKDVDKGDRIRLVVDKGGAELLESKRL
ncbi:MAG: hypothetical protein NXY57DRAFT_983294 [Lentinula lateritia]|uniref:AAA protein C-terminal winged helix domain-containing protein n=1 Tax=Lentinula lateritia TaxID=40482 RepID=A0ABQ8VLE1_9AGAR|nr:MAG: hypothetical protein NXY57DRAFT_983294 [Lentinula lateritia]KAJ4497228.1 hypothetical protein C8R41DRAFT_234453 [Lentinula lateritia]